MVPSPELKKIADNLETRKILKLRYNDEKIYVVYEYHNCSPKGIRNDFSPGWHYKEYNNFEEAAEDIYLVNNNSLDVIIFNDF